MEENQMTGSKKGISAIGVRYAIFGVVVTLLQIGLGMALSNMDLPILEKDPTLLSFGLVILSMDIIGFPLIYLLTKKYEKSDIPQQNLGVGQFLLGALYMAGIVGVGAIIGIVFNLLATAPFGVSAEENNGLAMLMLNSKPFMRILTVGILAPIFEELIFRKVLVDHLMKYGKAVAIVASGLMFGIFHGNFSQCFFAAGIGFFFAYIYIKTGRIRYTIGYHMMLNLTTSVITLAVLTKYLGDMEAVGQEAILAGDPQAAMAILPATLLFMGWIGVLFILALTGGILLIVHRKRFRLNEGEGAPTVKQAFKIILTNPGMWAFFAVGIALFLYQYLPPIFM